MEKRIKWTPFLSTTLAASSHTKLTSWSPSPQYLVGIMITPWAMIPNVDHIAFFHQGCLHKPLQWRHNERDGVSNHQPHHCLLKSLFRCKSKNIKAPRHWPFTGLHRWPVNSPHKLSLTRIFFNWWRHHAGCIYLHYTGYFTGEF